MDPRLVAAAKTGDVDYLQRLISEESLLLDNVALAGAETPLHVASMCGHLPFVQEMLKLKRQFAYDLNQDGFTPLHLASANGHIQIVVELLKLDSDFCTIQGWDNRLALHCAVVKGRIDVININELLSASPNSVEVKTFRGETALHLSVKNNQVAAFELLLEHIKKFKKEQILNEKDNQGNTILHHAVSRKQYKIIHLLLADDHVTELQLDVNSMNERGMTSLDVLMLFQSETGDLETLTELLEVGAKKGKDLPYSDPPQQERMNNNNNNNNQLGQSNMSVSANGDKLMTALTLIATATYQAVLSPPRGLWQDDGPKHAAGKSILASDSPLEFFIFIIGNTAGFYCSLLAILFLTGSNAITKLTLFAIYSTYYCSMYSILPGSILTASFAVLSFVLAILLPIFLRKFGGLPGRQARQNLNQ